MVVLSLLDPDDRRPVETQVVAALRHLLTSGQLTAGDRMPGEKALMRTYGLSRATVRKVFAELSKAGDVVLTPREGVFVSSKWLFVCDC